MNIRATCRIHKTKKGNKFLTSETEFVLFLAVLENSVLPMGCDSSHETRKSDISCLQTFFTRRNEKRRMTFGADFSYNVIVNILFKTSIFQ